MQDTLDCFLIIVLVELHADIFYLIHVDVWGPYGVQTFYGNKIFVTIVDDYSRMEWVKQPVENIRESTRTKKPPIWMTDYVTTMGTGSNQKPHSICNSISYDTLKPSYRSYLKAFSTTTEPKTFHEASHEK